MREGWEIKKLGEVCKFQGGSQPPKSTFINEERDGYVRLLQIRDFKSDDKAVYIPASAKNRLCSNEDILLGRYGASVGKICTGKSGAYNVALIRLQPIAVQLNRKFFLYYLESSLFQVPLSDVAHRSAQNGFNKNDISNFQIPIPPLDKQRRIVAILDEAFAAIEQAQANIERNIANAEELFQSKLNQIFSQRGDGWVEKKLGEVCVVKSGGTPSRSNKEYWDNGTIAWYSSGELNNLFTQEPERRITNKGLNNSNAKLFPQGSLLIGMYDTAALKMSIIDREATFNQAICGVEPDKNINLIFVRHAINAKKPELLKLRRGIRQKNLNQKKIKEIEIPLPVIDVQNAVVDQLEDLTSHLEATIFTYTQKLTQLEELKKSLLQQAFEGRLTDKEVAV